MYDSNISISQVIYAVTCSKGGHFSSNHHFGLKQQHGIK